MRTTTIAGLTALLPAAVVAQNDTNFNNMIDSISKARLGGMGNVVKLEDSSGEVDLAEEDDDYELTGAEIDLTFTYTKKYDISEEGNLIMPRNGRRYQLFPDLRIRTMKVDKGPCTIVYQNSSELEPPPPEGYEDFNETQQMTFGEDGGEFNFHESNWKKTMHYIYCGEDSGEDQDENEDDCDSIVKGDSATEKGSVCCYPPKEWHDELWDAHNMDDYLRDAIDHFNEEGWPDSVMNTFSLYDLDAYRKATDLKADPKKPYWEWNCGGINSPMCQSKDLSNWEACLVDPRRRLLLQAMENFSGLLQTAQRQFTVDALSDIIMTLPNLTKTLFPLEGEKNADDFEAPGDYNESVWMIAAGSILGIIGVPFSYGDKITKPAPGGATPKFPGMPTHVAALQGVVSAILVIVGVTMGPTLEEPFIEDDPHFTKFGEFSEDVGNNIVDRILDGYSSIYNTYFHVANGQEPPENIDADQLIDLMSEGKMIRPWQGMPSSVDDDMQKSMTNRFIAPITNLALQRNKVFLVKFPKDGFEIWKHWESDPWDTKRKSLTFDPCREGRESEVGHRTNYETAERKEPTRWEEFGGGVRRHVCNPDGSGYAFFAWSKDEDTAFTDYGWNEMEKRGIKLDDIVSESVNNQAKYGFLGGTPGSLDDKISEMADSAGSALQDQSVWDFWNLAVCDLSDTDDEGPGLIRMENCKPSHFLGDSYMRTECLIQAIQDRCAKHFKDDDGNDWPYELEFDE